MSCNRTNPTINVGALDDQYASGNKERKVNYSDMGNMIDLFISADGSLAAYIGLTSECIPDMIIHTVVKQEILIGVMVKQDHL